MILKPARIAFTPRSFSCQCLRLRPPPSSSIISGVSSRSHSELHRAFTIQNPGYTMTESVSIHFKCQGCMYSLMLKTSVEEITLSMLEGRIYKKVGLDESKVKLRLTYIPLLVGCEEECLISDDEDVSCYLMSIDKENRRCVLYVEVITSSELPEQLSEAWKSSFGLNYEELDDEIGPNGFTMYVEKEQAKNKHEEKEDDDGARERDECEDKRRDEYVEVPPIVESSQYIEEWEDGLGLRIGQEFPNKKALQDVVDKCAFVNCFGYAIKKSDKVRLVLKCRKDGCKWGLRASRIPKTDIFSIRRYTKIHTCSRSSQSTSNIRRKGTPQLVASLLHDDYPGQMQTPAPKIIMDLVQTKFGVQISYSTALRGIKLSKKKLLC